MSKIESALKRLAEGCFVCAYNYPDEFDALQDASGKRQADEWLGKIGYRLARLGEDGAFFMAHSIVTNEMRSGIREEMRAVRTKLDPIVHFFEVLREAQGRDPHIHPGDMIWESEISEAVRANSRLERTLNEMREISGSRATDSSIDRVRRVLEQLAKAGYIVETNIVSKGYQVTGKVQYLYQLLNFINENTPLLSDEGVIDSIDPQLRIDVPDGERSGLPSP
jgi:hypothetical protein